MQKRKRKKVNRLREDKGYKREELGQVLKPAAATQGAVYFRGVLDRAKRGCAGESLSSADRAGR